MELLTLRPCHCGEKKLRITQLSPIHYEVKCTKCADFAWGNSADLTVKRWNEFQDSTENPNELSTQPKQVKDCCKLSSNLVKVTDMSRPDVNVMVCRVCGCKHIRFKADPGQLASRG